MYQTILKHTFSLPFIFYLCAMAYALPDSTWAETWICPRTGQPDLYTDRSGPGCSQLSETKTYSPVTISPTPKSSQRGSLSPLVTNKVSSGLPQQQQGRKPFPFPEVSLPLPLLSVGQAKVGSITGSWTGLMTQLIVGYKADGKGPEILGDSNVLPYQSHRSAHRGTSCM